MSNEVIPRVVGYLADAVSDKLGRPSHVRKVMNRDEYFVQDPIFSFVQHGMRKGGTGYRVGYHFMSNGELWFRLVHSPIMSRLFKKNLIYGTLLEVMSKTAEFRATHAIRWSSREMRGLGGRLAGVQNRSFDAFRSELDEFHSQVNFIDDLFYASKNTGKGGGKAPVAGNYFYLLLSHGSKAAKTKPRVNSLVELTWPLFLCLYPVKPIERRSAGLARSMRAFGIPRVCEFSSIRLPRGVPLDPLCRGEVQGAHIKPHARGGSDRAENGLWLCEYHHRVTEGKVSGSRIEGVPMVTFVASK